MSVKTCSFFGHRDIEITDNLKEKVKNVIEDLIINYDTSIFLFGSRSNFDQLCHIIVTELKEKYPQIQRISYTCRHETCILESEKEKWEKILSHFQKKDIKLIGFEAEKEHKTKYTSGKACYIERNQAMIDNSDYCIFYYNENYIPPTKRLKNQNSEFYQSKSGTKLAYDYSRKKNKMIINIF